MNRTPSWAAANKTLASRVKAIAGGFLPEGSGALCRQDRGDRQSGAAGGDLRLPSRSYDAVRRERPLQPRRLRRQPGRAILLERHSARRSACSRTQYRKRLKVTQQARAGGPATASTPAMTSSACRPRSRPSSATWPSRIADANLVICRSGASTVSELAVIGRPAILVPYPYALDHDQAANAAALKAEGGAEGDRPIGAVAGKTCQDPPSTPWTIRRSWRRRRAAAQGNRQAGCGPACSPIWSRRLPAARPVREFKEGRKA